MAPENPAVQIWADSEGLPGAWLFDELNPVSESGDALFLRKRTRLVFGDSVFLECDARPPAEAVAQRVFALAGGDIFGDAGRDADGAEHAAIHVADARRAAELSTVDGAVAARGAEAGVKRACDPKFEGARKQG